MDELRQIADDPGSVLRTTSATSSRDSEVCTSATSMLPAKRAACTYWLSWKNKMCCLP